MSSDAIFLLFFLIMNNKSVGVNSIAASILITRILWQFIIIQKTDINILISFVVDNPFYFEEVAIMKLIIIKVISISVLAMIMALCQIGLMSRIYKMINLRLLSDLSSFLVI